MLVRKRFCVDGVKSLSPKARLRLVTKLKPGIKVKPTRRVWIPKKGTDEKRPLGIPTMYDRAKKSATQDGSRARIVLHDLTLPHMAWDLGKACHDAIEAIFLSIRRKPKFVLDADISKCFDRIDHEALRAKIKYVPHHT